MKTVFTALLLIAVTSLFAQATTQAEYNYMKLGYRDTEEKGLDVKKGYTATLLDEQTYSDLTLTVTMLKRADSTIAGLIVKTNGTGALGSGIKYYCIPSVNTKDKESFGWKEFFEDVNSMTLGQRNYLLKWLSYRLQYVMVGGK